MWNSVPIKCCACRIYYTNIFKQDWINFGATRKYFMINYLRIPIYHIYHAKRQGTEPMCNKLKTTVLKLIYPVSQSWSIEETQKEATCLRPGKTVATGQSGCVRTDGKRHISLLRHTTITCHIWPWPAPIISVTKCWATDIFTMPQPTGSDQ